MSRLFASPRRGGVLVFMVLLCCYGYFFPRWADWNQNSRFDLVMALVDHHTLQIDSYVENTGDYAEFQGHYYSDKAPGTALLAVPVYAAFEYILPSQLLTTRLEGVAAGSEMGRTLRADGTGVTADKLYMFIALTVTTFLVVAVPSAGLGVLVFWLLRRLGCSVPASLSATLAYGLGTSAFPYANSFVGHQTAAALLFGAFALLLSIRQGFIRHQWNLLAGFLLGYAVITEYPTALIAAVLGLYGVLGSGRPVRTCLYIALGSVPAWIALAAHDLAAFGTPLPVGYFHSALWSDVHETGFVSLTYPHADALWGITFGVHRGLFFLSPFLLLALPGYLGLWRDRKHRAEFWVIALVPAVFLLFNASSAMWQGGFAVGPRYIVASLPFLAIAAGHGLRSAWRAPVWRLLAVVLVLWSVGAVWSETIAGQSFPDYTPNPLFDLTLPLLMRGDIARNAGMLVKLTGWASLVPLMFAVLCSGILSSITLRSDAQDEPGRFSRPTAGARIISR